MNDKSSNSTHVLRIDPYAALNVRPAPSFTPRSFYDIVTQSKRKPNFLLAVAGSLGLISAIAVGGGVGASVALSAIAAFGTYLHQWYWWWYWVTWLTLAEAKWAAQWADMKPNLDREDYREIAYEWIELVEEQRRDIAKSI